MRSVNKVILIGNLTRDPEMKKTSSGQSIVNFGLATNRQWTTSNGEKRSSAEFHECVAWAKLAEICSDFLKKGMLVYVEGYLKTRSWDLEDGTRRFRTEVVLQDMIILEKKGDGSDDYEPSGQNYDDDDYDNSSSSSDSSGASSATAEATPKAESAPAVPAAETKTDAGQISADIDDDNMF